MRECKKCKKVKFDWQFLGEYFMGYLMRRTWLCKQCGREMSEEMINKEMLKKEYYAKPN